MGIPIFCGGCGDTGEVTKVTPGLRHVCGSTRIGLIGVDEMPARTAAPHGPGTGWGKAMPDPAANWSDYVGPSPHPNPTLTPPVSDNMVCPVCKGAGYDIQDKSICRMCGGSGVMIATTGRPAVEQYDNHEGPPVGGARHASLSHVTTTWQPPVLTGSTQTMAAVTYTRTAGRSSTADPYGTAEYQNMHGGGYYPGRGAPSEPFSPDNEATWYPKADTVSPGARVRQDRDYSQGADRPYQLNEATCPECGHAPTELRKTPADRRGKQDAVWTCPRCGPLVNIDRQPQIDPYRPHETGYRGPDRKALGKLSMVAQVRGEQRSGKLLRIVATIQEHNVVTFRESLDLARKTLIEFPEGRN